MKELTRRRFLNVCGIATSGTLMASCAGSFGGGTSLVNKDKLGVGIKALNPGIQLYTVRDQLKADANGTLKSLAEIGYREVELAGLPGSHSALDFKFMLEDVGLKCPVMHIQGAVPEQVDIANTVDASRVVLPLAMELLDKNWKPKSNISLDDFKRLAENLNKTGKEFQQHGLQFGFHNHAWDMIRIDGQLSYETLLTETDPDLVFMEIDLGWAHVAQADVLDLFRRYSGRFLTCHIKDFDNNNTIVDPGRGDVPLAEQLKFHELAGIQNFFVEHDHSENPIMTASAAYQFLQGLEYFRLNG